MRRSLLASCGRRLTGGYWAAWDQPLSELIWAVELVTELHQTQPTRDLWDELTHGD